ncbi:hypothetical protein Ae201684_012771 [Aphanomyces euteiches]|uniref:Reverse transcriptase Ty1/copia-type domain-containing protein n=1 Tax=Aphanomyces euteiches TaxID=100861 RepID=A0A6G0WQK1_9STRA|nr:hypothetical protein Ae201684_012771 [Aphanomyces euteiches]
MADVARSPHASEWYAAMQSEYNSMMANRVWILTSLPNGRKALKSKWVWKVKYLPSGDVERFKARLVIKGFLQMAGVDFTDTFAPVLRLENLRVFCTMIALLDLNTVQIDIKTAFLHDDLDEEIYMAQPEGFVDHDRPNDVCLLKKSLYGLKQAPRQWHKKLHEFLRSINFKQCFKDQCVYVKSNSQIGTTTYLAVYVDDIVIAVRDKTELTSTTDLIKTSFEVTNKGELEYILGIHVIRDRSLKTLRIHQEKFVIELLDRFHMAHCHPVRLKQRNVPYQNLVGALQYLVSATRPDIANAVRFLASHNHDYTQTHWRMAKRVLQYLKGSASLGLTYDGTKNSHPNAFSDVDFANDLQDSKSISGTVITLAGAAVIFSSRKQSLVGHSTTEVEFIAAAEAAKSIVWLRELLEEMSFVVNSPTYLHVDNQSTIQVVHRSSSHDRTKHIRLRFHFIKDLVEEGMIKLRYINTKEQVADILTRGIVLAHFEKLQSMLGMTSSQ